MALSGYGRVGEHRWECGVLVGRLILAEECRSYELHGEQVAAELDGEGFWWTIGDEKRTGSCARLEQC